MNENNKEILNDIIDLREKKSNPNDDPTIKDVSNSISMEDEVPSVEVKSDESLSAKPEAEAQASERKTHATFAQSKEGSKGSDEEKIQVVSKGEKFRKFLNLKEKKEKEEITDDAKASRCYAWLAYILFFIPLLINRKNSFVRHNANEGLEINLIDVIGIIFLLIGALVKPATVLTVLCVVVGIILLSLTLITKIFMIVVSAMGIKRQSPWFFNLNIIN